MGGMPNCKLTSIKCSKMRSYDVIIGDDEKRGYSSLQADNSKSEASHPAVIDLESEAFEIHTKAKVEDNCFPSYGAQ
jgi:hypothetical protein